MQYITRQQTPDGRYHILSVHVQYVGRYNRIRGRGGQGQSRLISNPIKIYLLFLINIVYVIFVPFG